MVDKSSKIGETGKIPILKTEKAVPLKESSEIKVFVPKPSVDKNIGLSIEKTAFVKVEPKENSSQEETTQYVVQLGDSIDSLVDKSLSAQKKNKKEVEVFEQAKEKFLQSNSHAIRETKAGQKYLLASSKVVLDGKIDTSKNKYSEEVKMQYEQALAKKRKENAPEVKSSQTKSKIAGTVYQDGEVVVEKGVGKLIKKYTKNDKGQNSRIVESYEHGHLVQSDEYKKNGDIVIKGYKRDKLAFAEIHYKEGTIAKSKNLGLSKNSDKTVETRHDGTVEIKENIVRGNKNKSASKSTVLKPNGKEVIYEGFDPEKDRFTKMKVVNPDGKTDEYNF